MASKLGDEIKDNALSGLSEQYDLAGFSPGWIQDLVTGCLSQTLSAKTYVGCKFVIGGGKKARGKYDPDMLKHFTEALRGAGFEDDRGASACKECMGTYKYQHDTDQDLKYLHVFPKVDLSAAAAEAAGADTGGAGGDAGPNSPEYQCVACTLEEFQELVAMNTPSFSQKRALLKRMKVMQSALEMLESMLCDQQTLTEQEQEMYDSMVDVNAKIEHLNKELEKMVAKGRLTKGEQKQMVDDLAKKLEEMDVAIATADAEGKAKKRDALEAAKKKAEEKVAHISEFKPIVYTMANEKELNDLRKELAALEKIENKGGLLKGDDLAKLAKKPNIEKRIADLEGEDKGWFEDECRDVLFTPAAAKPAAAKKPAAAAGGGNGWLVKAAKGGARPSGAGWPRSAPSGWRPSARRWRRRRRRAPPTSSWRRGRGSLTSGSAGRPTAPPSSPLLRASAASPRSVLYFIVSSCPAGVCQKCLSLRLLCRTVVCWRCLTFPDS